jgi:predicted nucleic acid-binding protein
VSRGWLIDTKVISEWVKPQPDAGVVRWLEEVDEDRVFLSVISLAEIRVGIERLASGRRLAPLDR